MYRPLEPKVDFPALEHEVLQFWRARDIFGQSLRRTADGPTWAFYEGPPTANGKPGVHHVEARVFKDIFPRYKTMRGYHVPRKAGWDCHGLPVEIAVEKELGFNGKKDIEEFGIAEFNARCRESVLRHVSEFSDLTDRMGYWVDMDDAYWTMASGYIESVWWSLKQIFEKGLLAEDHRVAPYCPRCGTGLSEHELAQGYEDVVDPSIFVRFPVTDADWTRRYHNLSLLVWTTTPWTLVSNTAAAVNPDAQYAVVAIDGPNGGEYIVVVADRVQDLFGEQGTVEEVVSGSDLAGVTYSRPFSLVDISPGHFVIADAFVTTDDGTGIVHLAPAFGEDDLTACKRFDLPVINPVAGDGTFRADIDLIGGVFFKDADRPLIDDLSARGLLWLERPYEHSYPHCWRCHTALLYYAQPSWYIRTTRIADQLLEANAETTWYPDTIQWGRYGDWLRNNVDWALSRNRYWGTPLPIWRCSPTEADQPVHTVCVGSLAELGTYTGRDLGSLDPHRPFVDEITFPCPECSATMSRVPEVIDCWYDSGAMPFAQWGYPHTGAETFSEMYPADFICEAIDQTRGWFYTLMAIGQLVFGQSAYRNVLCLGHILDEDGRKMSKHLGNVLPPIPLMDRQGADALRWFMAAGGSAWQSRRVGDSTVSESVRKVLPTYWATASFLSMYGRIAQFSPSDPEIPVLAERPVLDRWMAARTASTTKQVTDALENFDTQSAGAAIAELIDDMSNWYVRRSRRRFWDCDLAALATLHDSMRELTLLIAPFMPFVSERIWADLFRPTSPDLPESVHLAEWPDSGAIDQEVLRDVSLARRLVELGRAARAEAKVKTRYPLRRALVAATGWADLDAELVGEVLGELNVLTIDELPADAAEDLVDVTVKANFRALGAVYGKRTPSVAAAIAAAEGRSLSHSLATTGTFTLDVEGTPETITSDHVVITQKPRTGWSVASDHGEMIALDTTIDEQLRRVGVARDLIRHIQQARKDRGFEVTDRIVIEWDSSPELAEVVAEHAEMIGNEVLATRMETVSLPAAPTAESPATPNGSHTGGGATHAVQQVPELEFRFRLSLSPADLSGSPAE